MSFAPFSALKARITAETMRTDAAFIAEIPGWVRLAEDRMYGGLPEDRAYIRDMDASITLPVVDGDVELPDRFLEPQSVVWSSGASSSMPSWCPAGDLLHRRVSMSGSGVPQAYTIDGSLLRFWPAIDGVVALSYIKKIASLAGAADDATNEILDTAPGLYFFGVLHEAYNFLRDDDRAARSLNRYRETAVSLRERQIGSRLALNSLRKRNSLFGSTSTGTQPQPAEQAWGSVEW
jgi:hypothetical protein